MESNYGGSESNYGYSILERKDYGFESNYSSESRPSNKSRSSSSSESASESRYSEPSNEQSNKKYNSLDDIDMLIERLEKSMEGADYSSERVNKVLAERKQKINELKKLVNAARVKEAEERVIRQLENDNKEIDRAINSINKGFHR